MKDAASKPEPQSLPPLSSSVVLLLVVLGMRVVPEYVGASDVTLSSVRLEFETSSSEVEVKASDTSVTPVPKAKWKVLNQRSYRGFAKHIANE